MLTEPITTLTDYGIALESLMLGGMLWRSQTQQQVAMRCWSVALIAVAVAALLGGTCHGFVMDLERSWVLALWQMMLYALSVASFLMLVATGVSTLTQRWQRWFLVLALSKSVVYWLWIGTARQLTVAIADYLSTMGIVLLLQVLALSQGRNRVSAWWISAGIGLSVVAVMVQTSRLAIGLFNHNDLYHLVQMVALYLFYQGASLLSDADPKTS